MTVKQWGLTLAELTKVRITLFVAITTAAGYLLYRGGVDAGMVMPTAGLFILACGSAALNQYQERDTDAGMPRTRHRPIPSGDVSPRAALLIIVGLVTVGSLLLLWGGGMTAFLLGLLALFWYNGVYLFLKRRTAFAVVPGSLIGAISPMAGWVSAGGPIRDPAILAVATFFFIWQIPHFWLLLLKYGKEYEAVGYPSLTQKFSMSQIARLTFTWTVATATIGALIPLWAGMTSSLTRFLLLLAGAVLVIRARKLLFLQTRPFSVQSAFMDINIYALMVLVILCADRILI